MINRAMTRILAILTRLLPVFLAVQLQAADVQVKLLKPWLVEVNGVGDAGPWHIQYGHLFYNDRALVLMDPSGATAYFAHGNWLRRIDARKGLVTARWSFPANIGAMHWKDNRIQIDLFDESKNRFPNPFPTLDFDPNAPKIPNWPYDIVFYWGSAQLEEPTAAEALANNGSGGYEYTYKSRVTDANRAMELLPEAENAVRRDPLSPWMKIQLAEIYQALNHPGSRELLEQAVRMDHVDFTDPLRIATYLDANKQPKDLVREAFEIGYGQFWKQGNDPRLMVASLPLIMISNDDSMTNEELAEWTERAYRLWPWAEGSAPAWRRYAAYLESHGNLKAAELWKLRAEEAEKNSLSRLDPGLRFGDVHYSAGLVPLILLSALVYVLVIRRRYRFQHMIQVAAEVQSQVPKRFSFFRVEYWSRAERVSFLTISLSAYLACGFVGAYQAPYRRHYQADQPMNGSFAGPTNLARLQKDLAAGPDKNLFLAMAYHHSGELDKAEDLYRKLPQFPESWNNLGAILKSEGKEAEANRAFAEALRILPGMPEAELNLGKPAKDLWTETHEKYLPAQPMLAIPQRERMTQAFLGGISIRSASLSAWKGPFAGKDLDRTRIAADINPFENPGEIVSLAVHTVLRFLPLAVLCLALILLFLPAREVTQGPPAAQVVLEVFFPGTAPQWGFAGGPLVVACVYALWAVGATFLGGVGFPTDPETLSYFYPIPEDPEVLAAQKSGLVLVYSFVGLFWIPVALWLGNAAMLRYSRR